MRRPFARPFNDRFGYDIIDILLKHEPHVSSYCEIKEEGNFNDKTLSGWLKRLESLNIIDRSKRYIRLTPEAKEKREQKTLVLHRDNRRKKKKTIFQTDRDRYSILFILFNSAHLIFESKTEELDKEDILWSSITWRKGIVVDDLAFKLKRLYHPYMPNPPRFEKKLNGCNIEIFRHLELSEEEADQYLTLLKGYKPYSVLVEIYYNNQTLHKIEDNSLQDFIQICLLAFHANVYRLLECYYQNNRLKRKQTKEYQRYMTIWFGSKQNYYSLNIFPEPISKHANINKEEVEREIQDEYGMHIPLFSSTILSTAEVNVYKELERAVKDIYKSNIFDDELKGINKKYKILQEKYPDIIEGLLDILFPRFFRDIIREEYMRNVTNASNLLSR